jgi:hypothetical protein
VCVVGGGPHSLAGLETTPEVRVAIEAQVRAFLAAVGITGDHRPPCIRHVVYEAKAGGSTGKQPRDWCVVGHPGGCTKRYCNNLVSRPPKWSSEYGVRVNGLGLVPDSSGSPVFVEYTELLDRELLPLYCDGMERSCLAFVAHSRGQEHACDVPQAVHSRGSGVGGIRANLCLRDIDD